MGLFCFYTVRREGSIKPHRVLEGGRALIYFGFLFQLPFVRTPFAVCLTLFCFLALGTGNGDTSTRSGLLEAVTLAAKKGILVVVLTQCFQGGVLLDKYSVGVALRAAGVVSGKLGEREGGRREFNSILCLLNSFLLSSLHQATT